MPSDDGAAEERKRIERNEADQRSARNLRNGSGRSRGSDNTGPSQTYALAANSSGCDIVNGPAFCVWGVTSLDLAGRFATGVDFGATSGVAAFDNVSVSAVPLPAAAWLLMSALGGLGVIRRKRAV